MPEKNTASDVVCPESTIESANLRDRPKRFSSGTTKTLEKDQHSSKLVCESTIESANRRNFIRKAAAVTAAVGIGGVLMGGKNIIPESAAKTASCCPLCYCGAINYFAKSCFVLDDTNNGCVHCCKFGYGGVLSFGVKQPFYGCGFNEFYLSGQAIASAGACWPNQWGLDFYTNCEKRVGITNRGLVGIGTANPDALLTFGNVSSQDKIFLYDGKDCKYGFGIVPGSKTASPTYCCPPCCPPLCGAALRIYDGADSTNHISFGKYNGTCFTEFMRINNKGRVGIGTTSPSDTLQVCGIFSAHYSGCGSAVQGTSSIGTGVFGCSPCGRGVKGCSANHTGVGGTGAYGVHGCSVAGAGVQGCSPCGTGVKGYASSGVGVHGCSASHTGVGGTGKVSGIHGCSSTGVGIQGCSSSGAGVQGYSFTGAGIVGSTVGPCAIPFVAQGVSGQVKNLQQWQIGCSTPLSVVNKCGWVGVATCKPQTPLQVKGGMSLGIRTETLSTCYTMTTTCFAILANPSASGKNVTLPAAKYSGMVVYIKNISANTVTVKAANSDMIENSDTYPLSAQFSSVTLIAGGGSPGTWYVLSSAA